MVKIISDSTCDLPKALAEQFDIDIIPLHIVLGDEEYRDGVDITKEDIFSWADKNKTTPKTAAVSITDVIDCVGKYVKEGREVICFHISESMSTTGNVMRLAVEELEAEDKVTVINSANLSTGISLLVLEAARMAQEGKSVAEIVKTIEETIPLVRSSFVVDTLVYLHRGGRCSGLAAMAGGALKLHPRIAVENGKMTPGKKYRGNIDKVVKAYVKDMEEELKKARPDNIFITHSGCDATLVDEVRTYLESLGVFQNIYEAVTGGVIASHCGPGTLGVLYIVNEA